jgi:hypothetical protein
MRRKAFVRLLGGALLGHSPRERSRRHRRHILGSCSWGCHPTAKQPAVPAGTTGHRIRRGTRRGTVVRQRFFWIPATDTDIISAQHFWTGGPEPTGPGCYDAVAIARAAVSECWVMCRFSEAGNDEARPHARSRA